MRSTRSAVGGTIGSPSLHLRSRDEVREIASKCVDEVVDLVTGAAK